MNNKYYTPSLEELHIGFEYEIKIGKYWQPAVCSGIAVGHKTFEDYIRVKYLDKEDIESLGFIFDWERSYAEGYYGFIYKDKDGAYLDLNTIEHTVRISMLDKFDKVQKLLFTIKNKSELKKLMKQLNIE